MTHVYRLFGMSFRRRALYKLKIEVHLENELSLNFDHSRPTDRAQSCEMCIFSWNLPSAPTHVNARLLQLKRKSYMCLLTMWGDFYRLVGTIDLACSQQIPSRITWLQWRAWSFVPAVIKILLRRWYESDPWSSTTPINWFKSPNNWSELTFLARSQQVSYVRQLTLVSIMVCMAGHVSHAREVESLKFGLLSSSFLHPARIASVDSWRRWFDTTWRGTHSSLWPTCKLGQVNNNHKPSSAKSINFSIYCTGSWVIGDYSLNPIMNIAMSSWSVLTRYGFDRYWEGWHNLTEQWYIHLWWIWHMKDV